MSMTRPETPDERYSRMAAQAQAAAQEVAETARRQFMAHADEEAARVATQQREQERKRRAEEVMDAARAEAANKTLARLNAADALNARLAVIVQAVRERAAGDPAFLDGLCDQLGIPHA